MTPGPLLAPDEVRLLERFVRVLELEDEKARARVDPAFLISFMSAPDERTAETFSFGHLRSLAEAPADGGWLWQRDIIGWFHREQRCIALKARQLGITWLSCAYVLWTALCKRGSLSLVYRQKEEEAVENVRRCWSLFQSLPPHLRFDAEVLTPARGNLPSTEIKLRFPDGSVSRIVAMSSASASGHGKTAAVILLDEFSRIDRAAEIMKAVQPAAGSKGKILIISTANGVSNPESGEGNQFHWLWSHAEDTGFDKRFLGWDLHPDRDVHWYNNDPEVRGLRSHERAEQYPGNEDEAFALTTNNFFEAEEVGYYGDLVPDTLVRLDFERHTGGKAKIRRHDRGGIRIYREPNPDHAYAIGVDVSSGTGLDFSAACVIDLASMEIAAELYDRIDPDLLAFQLHYLGRWFGTRSGCRTDALIGIENQGGHGNAVITPLRDGREGRPPYPNLYRHELGNRPDRPIAKPFGMPMGSNNRSIVMNGLGKAVREGFQSKGEIGLPHMPRVLLDEAKTFLRGPLPGRPQTGTWPRAQDGTHDDMIFATAIAIELHRQRGHHPEMAKRRALKRPRERLVARPWQKAA